jgi:hypothetical protein
MVGGFVKLGTSSSSKRIQRVNVAEMFRLVPAID